MSDKSLPIWTKEEELLSALEKHSVVVIISPTGTGKTTQVPKMLLEAGYANRGKVIGVTQPRRIAATSVSRRVAEERQVVLGEEVGYKIRFDDQTCPDTELKFMTDGILLMEAQSDPMLSKYSVIIVDEAHERSVNIDFTLGLLNTLALGKRSRDLKVVVMSATMRPKFFSDYFGGAPVIEATAPIFPIDTQYMPPKSSDPDGTVEAVVRAVRRIHRDEGEGDVLVFLSGAQLIRDSVKKLRASHIASELEVLPLYGRLSYEEQQRVFDRFPNKRKVVVATNIAESSITIDGVRFVVDSGVVKVNNFRPSSGISQLREQLCSQASIEQRRGRCGRTGPGVCYRLYREEDIPMRAPFQESEIRRSDLSEVMLRLAGLGIGHVKSFPFPERPGGRDVRAALRLLQMIDALDERFRLTKIGKTLLGFPLQPRIGRMIMEAAHHAPYVMDEVIIVAAFLSADHPYVMAPTREEEDMRRSVFEDQFGHRLGDSLVDIRVFRAFLKASNPEKFCDRWHLDLKSMEELVRVHEQLTDIAKDQGYEVKSGGDPSHVVRCIAHAYPRFIFQRTGRRKYSNSAVNHVQIHPGSTLFHDLPDYIVAGEVMETSRIFARKASVLDRNARKGLNLKEILERPDDGESMPQSPGRRRRKMEWLKRRDGGGGGGGGRGGGRGKKNRRKKRR